MVAWYWIPIFTSIGAIIGVFTICLCKMAKQSDEIALENYKINNIKYE